jgi:hypothetical protein
MPVIAQGLDYSARRLSGWAIRQAGYQFVVRYLNFPGQIYPALNAAETADLTASGVEVHGVYEQNTNDPAGGYAGGRRLAAQAVASATAADLPPGRTIFMCADAWLYTHGIPISTAMAFLDGARDIIGSSHYVLGAYGFADFVYAAQDGGHADRFWLCGAESGVRQGIHLYQWNNGFVTVDGLSCDLNKQYLPLTSGGQAGGGQGQGDPDMPILVKGDQSDAIYSVSSTVEDFAKRHIGGLEATLLAKAGVRTVDMTQAEVDAIPNVEDILAVRQQLELKGEFGKLVDDEKNIIAAVRSIPTGGQVDIPAFVAALVPALAPVMPKGLTAEQVEAVLVNALNNVRLTTGG